jgi:IS30 family transposase
LHLQDGVSTAETVAQALRTALALLPAALRRTLTWDQGKELAQHQQITAQTGTSVFFCLRPRHFVRASAAARPGGCKSSWCSSCRPQR